MRRWIGIAALMLLVLVCVLLLYRAAWWRAAEVSTPLTVPSGDHEIAWLHISTSGESWENFCLGNETRGDDSSAHPAESTSMIPPRT